MTSTTTKKLTDAERKDLKLQWRDKKRGKYRSGKFRSGQAVKWKGREWLIWDFEAEMDEPEGFRLVLVSPDGEYVAQGVSVGEVKLMNQSLDLIIASELLDMAERIASTKTAAPKSPFEKAIEKAIEKEIKEAKRSWSPPMSLDNLMHVVRPPSSSLEGAPKGTNARYYYKEMFRDIAKGLGWELM